MKKHLSILAACMLVATGASATALTQGGATTVSTTNCPLLKEGVTLNLSKDVAGAYACESSTNVIAVSTCHPNGRKVSSTNNYFYTTSSKGGKPAEASNAVCDGAGSAANGKAETEAGVPAPEAPANPG